MLIPAIFKITTIFIKTTDLKYPPGNDAGLCPQNKSKCGSCSLTFKNQFGKRKNKS